MLYTQNWSYSANIWTFRAQDRGDAVVWGPYFENKVQNERILLANFVSM